MTTVRETLPELQAIDKLRGSMNEVFERLGEIAKRLESSEHEAAAIKTELRLSLDVIAQSLNVLRESVLDMHQDLRELIEDRRTLEARVTIGESNWKKLLERSAILEERVASLERR